MQNDLIDVAIIGSGPAGLSAGINVAARNKKPVIFGRNQNSSWLLKAEKINNHLGMPDMSGSEMMAAFNRHAEKTGLEIKEGRVVQIVNMGKYYTLNFDNNLYNARAVIIATGVSRGKSVPGESELVGKGVSYCATCDGMLYRGMTVAVYGDSPEAEEDAAFLSEICEKVYYIYSYMAVERKFAANVEAIKGKLTEITGENEVQGVKTGGRELDCAGVFIIKESIPASNLVYGLEMEDNHIKINRYGETNLPGVFAAGDCTGWPLQVSNAVGEGLVAAQQAVKYLDKL